MVRVEKRRENEMKEKKTLVRVEKRRENEREGSGRKRLEFEKKTSELEADEKKKEMELAAEQRKLAGLKRLKKKTVANTKLMLAN